MRIAVFELFDPGAAALARAPDRRGVVGSECHGALLAGERPQEGALGERRVLVLVYEKVRQALGETDSHALLVAQQAVCVDQEVAGVERAAGGEELVVTCVDGGELTRATGL